MKKPTKQQRRKIYQEALKKVFRTTEPFTCNLIEHEYINLFYDGEFIYSQEAVMKVFPEFLKQRPADHYDGVWWSNRLFTKKQRQHNRAIALINSIKILQMRRATLTNGTRITFDLCDPSKESMEKFVSKNIPLQYLGYGHAGIDSAKQHFWKIKKHSK